ncbi:S-adenosyl-L-methionine-dependent methyltransferase [Cercophora newfieldiana]|uniref:tRNA (adenine(58)-N(1))-methyltransferase catalytic subunit TRM61 n=1 Tax=Cercophora newfieldiana TaxID=92897 RepID=A0AA40CU75_9PEZI|nr:S-adenosyl-L-methionine-dependent methyltransferase [Cercophora newfieldiana]
MEPTSRQKVSPFLDPGSITKPNSLAVIQLSRDNFVPVYLKQVDGEHDGYAEGAVLNTRFGSFPHSTLIGVPWGSQIRASKVDTGSRGRKRKRQGADDATEGASSEANESNKNQKNDQASAEGLNGTKQAVADSSGFVHILPPTPEIWTTSLPHRTQVVYTPDYSYVLYRLRAKPGSTIIEAGAGSGSFTHASVRAVYNGYPAEGKRTGKVISFEYNEDRYHKMQEEIGEHGLKGLVHLAHRNVYKDGFLLDGKSPEADAVFLDLPAPWEALHHLSRTKPKKDGEEQNGDAEWVSPLHPKKSAHLCTFSPCIEQVTKTVSAMRRLGWIDIEMVEIANRKLHTLRDRVGLNLQIDRGVNNSPRDVEEALTRLTEIEDRFRENARPRPAAEDTEMGEDDISGEAEGVSKPATNGKPKVEAPKPKFPWQDGRLITRGEPEIKTHTSYLVFATLPIEWSEEDEAAATQKYPVGEEQKQVVGTLDRKSRKEERRAELQNKSGNRKARKQERDAKIAEAMTTTTA